MEKDKTIRRVAILIAIVLFFWVLKTCASFIIPFAIAVFVFILISPIMEKLDDLHIPHILSIALVLILFALLCLGFVYLLIMFINVIMGQLPSYIEKVNAFDAYISSWVRNTFHLELSEFPSIITMLNIDWGKQVKNALTSVSSASASILGDVAMIIVYLLFLLMERKTIYPKITAAFPESKKEVSALVQRISKQTSRYLSIKILVSFATGVCFYIICLLTGVDLPIVWGVLAFLLNFIPTIGSIVVTALATFVALIQFMPHWGHVFLIFFCFLATEMIIGNIIDPKLQGGQLDMSPLVILVMLAVWGYVWGIAGMFLAVPITCVIQIICASVPSMNSVSILLSQGLSFKKEK